MAVNKIAWVPMALMSIALVSAAQEKDHPCKCHPREAGESGSRNDWEGYRDGGISWHYSIDEALKIAEKEKKLVFWYRVAGDLDKEGC